MKIGDIVRVVHTGPMSKGKLSVGDKGKVVDLGNDLVFVLFDKFVNVEIAEKPFLYHDKSYQLAKEHVEVIR